MTKTKTKLTRVDREWEKRARDIMSDRFHKGLAKCKMEDLGLPEYTRLQLRCPSWKEVERELRTLPKRKNE